MDFELRMLKVIWLTEMLFDALVKTEGEHLTECHLSGSVSIIIDLQKEIKEEITDNNLQLISK